MKFCKIKNIFKVVLLYSIAIYSQEAYFGYIEEPTHSRSIALGGTGTAGSNGGISYYNPANGGIINTSFISFEYGMMWGDISRGIIEGIWDFRDWFIGGSFQTQSNTFTITDATGNYTTEATGIEQASMISLIGGLKKGRFSIGLSVNGFHHKIFDLSSSAISLSGGVNYSLIPDKLRAGISIINAGRYHKGFYSSNYEFHRDLMSTTGRAGVMWRDTLRNILPINIFLDVAYGKNYDNVTVPVGVEFWPIPSLALRIGKCFLQQTELFTSGVGINWENLSFDASFVPYSIEDETFIKWTAALRYELKKKKLAKESTSQIKINKEIIVTPIEETDSVATLPEADTLRFKLEKKRNDVYPVPSENIKDKIDNKDMVKDSLSLDTLKPRDTTTVKESPLSENKTKEEVKNQDSSSTQLDANITTPLDTSGIPYKKEDGDSIIVPVK